MSIAIKDRSLLYLDPPNTGSTSLCAYFNSLPGAEDVGKHEIPDNWEDFEHRICSIRNPYDFYFGSWFRQRYRWGPKMYADPQSRLWRDPPEWLEGRIRCLNYEDFSEWLINELSNRKPHFMLYQYTTKANFFVRMENMDEDLQRVLSEIEGGTVQLEKIPQLNKTDRGQKKNREYWRHYSREARDQVERIHGTFLKKFDYVF